jgi:single-stranded-DNA-specific exonuclease
MWKIRPYNKDVEIELLKKGKEKLLSRLLSQRISNANEANKFTSGSYTELSHPHTLNGVKEAVELFRQAVINKEKIAVMGDYDCDGILSSVMLNELCNVMGLQCTVVLPNRLKHGYGLTEKSVNNFKSKIKEPPFLLFIVDCGSSSEKEIKELKEFGVKHIVVIDHHIVDPDKQSKSADVLINWHLSNTQEMCAAGLVFQFIRGVRWLTKKVDPINFLSYVAVGTLADVSPIEGDNRIIVKNGLKPYALNNIMASGLNALISKSRVYGDLSVEDVLFKIAPKLNAAGRLKDPHIAYNLLIEHDLITAELMAQNLAEFNDDRKAIQKEIELQAIKMVKDNPDAYKYGIIVFGKDWHIGVLGIVASRLTEEFYRPAVVIGSNEGTLKGSGRSIGITNLKEILDSCSECFSSYGGHALAAGLTLKEEYKDTVNEIFNKACQKYYEKNGYPERIRYYDAKLYPSLVTIRTMTMLLETLYPYCSQKNPEPVFILPGAVITETKIVGEEKKVMVFRAIRDGQKTELKFRTFTDKMGTEIDGKKADIIFTFPQSFPAKFEPSLSVIDIIFEK